MVIQSSNFELTKQAPLNYLDSKIERAPSPHLSAHFGKTNKTIATPKESSLEQNKRVKHV